MKRRHCIWTKALFYYMSNQHALASRSGSVYVWKAFLLSLAAAEGPESWRMQMPRWSRSSTRRMRTRISWSSWRRWSTSWRRSTATSRRSSAIGSSTTSGYGWRRGETSMNLAHQHQNNWTEPANNSKNSSDGCVYSAGDLLTMRKLKNTYALLIYISTNAIY